MGLPISDKSLSSYRIPLPMPAVRKIWKLTDPEATSRDDLLALARQALQEGDSLLAFDISQKALKIHDEKDLALRQFAASALINAQCPMRASNLLEELVAEGAADEETLGLLASAYKDIWEISNDPGQEDKYGHKALEQYKRGFEETGGTYVGINAAAMHVLLGEKEEAREYGEKVLALLDENTEADYWASVTRAEANLTLGNVDEAASLYQEAVQLPDALPAWLATSRKQAMQLAEAMDCVEKFENVFPVPGIVLCTGHMIDFPDREEERFPSDLEPLVREAIDKILEETNAQYGFSSAGCGADLIFIEAMLARGAEVHVFLPFVQEDFLETSVRYAGPEWMERFESALDKVAHVHHCTAERYLGYDELFNLCNDVAAGFSIMRGHGLNLTPTLLTVWDGQPGVAGQLTERWQNEVGSVAQVDSRKLLEQLRQRAPRPIAVPQLAEPQPALPPQAQREIKALIFADVTNFSQLRDEDNPLFVDNFLSGVAELLEQDLNQPTFQNTWGDGFFFVYDDLSKAVQFALDFRDWVEQQEWESHGLPAELNIRISLHVGPVYSKKDPLLKRRNYFGTHVARAARIEPITLPGQVYASENVAALLSVGHKGFDFEYVGDVDLPKKYGSFPIYHLHREGIAE